MDVVMENLGSRGWHAALSISWEFCGVGPVIPQFPLQSEEDNNGIYLTVPLRKMDELKSLK